MPEPLSIATGVASLLKVTWTVGVELKAFRDGVKIVSAKLDGLVKDVEGLKSVLESMQVTFENITAVHGTGHIGSHWQNIAQALEDGGELVGQLRDELAKVNKTTTFLDGPRKQLRLNMATETIAAHRVSIQSYRDALGLSLQTVILWNQVSQNEASEQVLPTLSELQAGVRRIALEMNERIAKLQATIMSEQDVRQEAAFGRLRECVKSAASIVSSASTILAPETGEAADVLSDFGDCFPEQSEMLSRWVQSAALQEEYDDRATLRPPESVADLAMIGDSGGESEDSDVDLESEITMLIYENAKKKSTSGDRSAAERMIQKCLSRLTGAGGRDRSIRHADGQPLEIHVLTSLYVLYTEDSRWLDAQGMLVKRMQLQERMTPQNPSSVTSDTFDLAQLLFRQGKNAESELHARRALKEFRKHSDVRSAAKCVDLITEICEKEGREDDGEAYKELKVRILGIEPKNKNNAASQKAEIEAEPGAEPSVTTTSGAQSSSVDIGGDVGKGESEHVAQLIVEKEAFSTDRNVARHQEKNDAVDMDRDERLFTKDGARSVVKLRPELKQQDAAVHRHGFASGHQDTARPPKTSQTWLHARSPFEGSTGEAGVHGDGTKVRSTTTPPGEAHDKPTLSRDIDTGENKLQENVHDTSPAKTTIYEQLKHRHAVSRVVGKDDAEHPAGNPRGMPETSKHTPIHAYYTSARPDTWINVSGLGVKDAPYVPLDVTAVFDAAKSESSGTSGISGNKGADDKQSQVVDGAIPRGSLSLPLSGSSGKIRGVDGAVRGQHSIEVREHHKSSTVSSDTELLVRRPASNTSSHQAPQCKRQVVVVGDSGVGKTALSLRLVSGAYFERSDPTLDDVYQTRVGVDGKVVELTLIETSSFEDHDAIRKIPYAFVDVVLICFSIGWPQSYQNVLHKWVGEVSKNCPNIPVILVGLQADQRHPITAFTECRLMTPELAVYIKDEIGASEYLECSAKSGTNVLEVFVAAARHAIFSTAAQTPNHEPTVLSARPRSTVTFRPPSPATLQAIERPEIRRKLVITGDGAIGKTALMLIFSKGFFDFTKYSIETLLDNYVADVEVDGKRVELDLWDTGGFEEWDDFRPRSYPDAHVVLVCFSIDRPASYDNVTEKVCNPLVRMSFATKHRTDDLQWMYEVRHFCARLPTVLVGLKKDLRNDLKVVAELAETHEIPVTPQQVCNIRRRSIAISLIASQGEDLRKTIGAVKYLECSSKTKEGVRDVFECATRSALLVNHKQKRSGFRALFKKS
ncbi:GTP-binding protein Rho1 [Elasticomyces elasticus]|nr:GTP-binding protein Rho1 [Elasticomyces elasticus]